MAFVIAFILGAFTLDFGLYPTAARYRHRQNDPQTLSRCPCCRRQHRPQQLRACQTPPPRPPTPPTRCRRYDTRRPPTDRSTTTGRTRHHRARLEGNFPNKTKVVKVARCFKVAKVAKVVPFPKLRDSRESRNTSIFNDNAPKINASGSIGIVPCQSRYVYSRGNSVQFKGIVAKVASPLPQIRRQRPPNPCRLCPP